jgi:tetratricopeptide (TPR) repeat protein
MVALAEHLADRRAAAGLLALAALDVPGAARDAAVLRAAALAPAHPVAAAAADERLRAAGDHEARARALEARRDAAEGAAERAAWALRAGEAWEAAGERSRAVTAYRESLALAPDSLPALQALRRAHLAAGAFGEARAALRAEGAALRDPALAAAAFAAAAELAAERLADRAGALADLRRAVERDPADAALARRLQAALAEGDEGERCEARELAARAERDPDRAAAAWLDASRFALDRLADRARALAHLDRALAAAPGWRPALLARGRLLAAAGRPLEAARDLAACAKAGDGDAAAAHVELADLYAGALADAPRAASHLAAALAAAPADGEALSRAARLHREARNWPAAADALRRLLALPALAPADAIAPLLALADVRAEGYGDADGARALCERALALAPDDTAALERAARLRGLPSAGAVAALTAAADAAPDAPSRARAHLRAARVLAAGLGEKERAQDELRRALAADPGCAEARRELAELCAATDPAAAVEEYRRLLEADPASVSTWRALYRLFTATKAHDRAFVAAGALRFLGVADATTDALCYAECSLQAPGTTSQALGPAEWGALRHPAERNALSDVLALAGDAIGEFGAVPGGGHDRVKAHPAARVVAEACNVFGVPAPPLVAGDGSEVVAEPGDPPVLRIGPDLGRRLSPAEQRFAVARAVARLRARSGVAARLGPARLAEVMAAVVRQALPDYEGLAEPSEALLRSVGRALPRKVRRALEEPARALSVAGPIDVAAWQAALAATADRAALLFAGDVPSALGVALGGPRPKTPEDVAAAVRARPAVAHLLVFAASEEHFRLRQRLKLAVA